MSVKRDMKNVLYATVHMHFSQLCKHNTTLKKNTGIKASVQSIRSTNFNNTTAE